MKGIRKFIIAVVPFVLLLCFVGCSKNAEATRKYNIVISSTEISLELGETKQLNASYGAGFTVTYTSSDESVATVSATGLIEAKSTGIAYVDVSADGQTKTCKVYVVKNEYAVELNSTSAKIVVGTKFVITASAFKNGEEISEHVVWSFDAENVCWKEEGNTVVFSSQTAGTYQVTATYKDSSCVCSITVVTASELA